MDNNIVFTPTPDIDLAATLAGKTPFVVTDSNVDRCAMPLLPSLTDAPKIVIEAGEQHKTLSTCQLVWQAMMENGLTRKVIVVNVGGGVVTDLGGFCASTYMRGVPFVNVPTTLLCAVDASTGGKTGVDFMGYKNMVGVFARPSRTIISDLFLRTLDRRELLSGYAEMIKHSLIEGPEALASMLRTEPDDVTIDDIRRNVATKSRIVEADPQENGLRKVLNLGHTVGHALESVCLEAHRPIAHGYAVAWGLITALVLSRMLRDLRSDYLYSTAKHIANHYGAPPVTCDDYPALLEAMHHDKKNPTAGKVNFTLLDSPGRPAIDCTVGDDDIRAALDITRDLTGA